MLTIIIPTRNRPRHCAALLRLLIDCRIRHPIIVADSSDEDEAATLQAACAGIGVFRRFPSDIEVIDKMQAVISAISTPYVVMVPDDDVTLPHAIEASLAHLTASRDFVAAQGYVFDYGIAGDIFDIARLRWYTPTIASPDPLLRMCDLMQCYQPFMWAVFRTEALAAALALAGRQRLIGLQEVTTMLAAVFQGKVTWLPHIYSLRGMQPSMTRPAQSNPVFSLLDDSEFFFSSYGRCRRDLVRFYRERIDRSETRPIGRLIDLSLAAYLLPDMSPQVMWRQVERLAGRPAPPIDNSVPGYSWRPAEMGDVFLASSRPGRRYLWRHGVPWGALKIPDAEILKVQEQLDRYEPPLSAG